MIKVVPSPGSLSSAIVPPCEVWSLLGTLLATELVMLAVIVWYAVTAG